jgi:predicted ATPase
MQLIGRDPELALLAGRVRTRRLVTLIGPGGIGKTTLARAAAARLGAEFPLGSRFVDLTRVDSADAVGEALAGQLGFPSFAALLASPQDQPVLLVVDNCEHVVAAAAGVVRELLDACPAPTVLATSRSPLDLPGESVVVLGPLEAPRAGGRDSPALVLFRERVLDAGGELRDDDLEVAGELCRRLDGVPLALELAAARARSMTPAEILRRLDDPLALLSRPRYGGAHRHRSLRSTIEWSYRLLDEADARVFDALGVVAGPFTATTAHAVAGAGGAGGAATADRLDALVAASLLAVERRGDTTWYRLLHTLRGFALERLDERGERRAVHDRYADHVVSAVTGLVTGGGGRWRPDTLTGLLGMYENVTAALRWCVAEDAGPDRSLLLTTVLWGVTHQGRIADIASLGERVLARWPEPREGLWPDAAATVATCRYLLGDPAGALELATRALPVSATGLFAPSTLRRVMAHALRAPAAGTGGAGGGAPAGGAAPAGPRDAAVELFAEGAALARDRAALALALELDVGRAVVLADAGRVGEALALVRAAEAEAAAHDSELNTVWAATAHGYVLLRRDPDLAVPVAEAALAASRRIGYPAGMAANLRTLAMARLAAGRPGDAARLLHELLSELWTAGLTGDLRMVLDITAAVAHRAGRDSWPDLAASAAGLPVVHLMTGACRDLFPLPPAPGRALPPAAAARLARAELTAILGAAAGGGAAANGRGTPVPAPVAPVGVFRRSGEFWELGYSGRTVHLKAAKGLSDLAVLLAAPGAEVHCLDLAGHPAAHADGVRHDPGDPLIDDVARRDYERRIRELQAEVDEAADFHDAGRAERVRAELDALVDHLSAALGIGGRVRTAAGPAERARSAVTQRVRVTIRRIADVHPELGRHLRASVTTGTFLSYRPETAIRWETARAGP